MSDAFRPTAEFGIPVIADIRGERNRIGFHPSCSASPQRPPKIRVHGNRNRITVGRNCAIRNLYFHVIGDDNEILIGNACQLAGNMVCKGEQNKIHIMRLNKFVGAVFHAEYGRTITVGEAGIFSRGLIVRTGDSHSVIDIKQRRRINMPQDVTIGERVWAGYDVSITKGAHVGPDTIIGAGSLVNRRFEEGRCILAGAPAEVKRKGVIWDVRSLPEYPEEGFMDDAFAARGVEAALMDLD